MNNLKTICEQVISAKEKSGKSSYRSEDPEFEYEVLAGNNADRIAKACLIMREALELYTDKSTFEQGHGLGFHEDAVKAIAKAEELFK